MLETLRKEQTWCKLHNHISELSKLSKYVDSMLDLYNSSLNARKNVIRTCSLQSEVPRTAES
jgi:hypothetical protein